MKILTLDDRGDFIYPLIEWLEKDGHEVTDAATIGEAEDALREAGPFDCIVVDLNMPTDGLSLAEDAASAGGVLSGWKWLENHVLASNPSMRSSTVILSAYLDLFQKLVTPRSKYSGVHLVAKGGESAVELRSVLAQIKQECEQKR